MDGGLSVSLRILLRILKTNSYSDLNDDVTRVMEAISTSFCSIINQYCCANISLRMGEGHNYAEREMTFSGIT